MANLQANLRSQCTVAWDEPQRLLQSVNTCSTKIRRQRLRHLIFAEYDDQTQRLRYATADISPLSCSKR